MRESELTELEEKYQHRYLTDPVFSAKVKLIADVVRTVLPSEGNLQGPGYLAGLVAAGLLEEIAPPIYERGVLVAEFAAKGEPVSKERPRIGGQHKGAYTPGKTKAYEEVIGWAARQGVVRPLARGRIDPTKLYQVDVLLNVAGTWEKDVDNMVKSILDGMNGIVYMDDKQVVVLNATKVKAPVGSAIVAVYEVSVA